MEQDLRQNIFSLEKDRRFHRCLALASNNVHVVEIMKYILDAMQKPVWQKYIVKNITIEGHKETYVRNHRMILEAIEMRDPERAQAAMLEHLQGGILLDDWDQ
jgi:GntR family transcriptional repressor for pyruvate dehydrogenase complex